MSGYIPPVDNKTVQHEGTEGLAINNTFLNRVLVLLALKTVARFYQVDGPCIPISDGLIVKMGPFVHLTEATTMSFVAANTSLPVPHVHCSFVHNNRAYILMERIQGDSVAKAWGTLSAEARDRILAQLRTMLQELRSLQPPPGTGVESCCGGSLRDSRIPRSWPRFGPYKTIQSFHLWLRHELRPEMHPTKKDTEGWKDIEDMAAKQDGPWRPPVFTHGDLNPCNILIRGEQVTGIIDWEFAGWHPAYWEYTSVWFGNLTRQEWQKRSAQFLDPYPEELKMEATRNKWWGEF